MLQFVHRFLVVVNLVASVFSHGLGATRKDLEYSMRVEECLVEHLLSEISDKEEYV